MKTRDRFFSFRGGLKTSGPEGFPDGYETFQDVEVDDGGCDSRGGMVRLARIANTESVMDFDATNNYATLPSGFHTTIGTVWTLEILFETDTITADRYIMGRNGAGAACISIRQTTTSTVVAVITDSAANAVTLTWTSIAAGTLCGLQIVRNGTAITGWLNGTTQTGTLAANNTGATGAVTFGRDNTGGYHDGGTDNCRVWSVARTTKRDLYRRLLNPRSRAVLFCWVFTQGAGDDIIDYGVRGAHLATLGSPAWNRSPLALNPAPIQGLGFNVRRNATREIWAANAGRLYTLSVT